MPPDYLMRTILKAIFFIFLLVIVFFIFFPFERIKREIRISMEKTGIKYKTLSTDYFAKITLENAEVEFSGRKVQIKNMAFYFKPFFIFRKNPVPQKVYIYGVEYDIQALQELKGLITLPGEEKRIVVGFKNIKLKVSDLKRVFYISGRIKDKRIDFVGGIRGLNELEKLVDSGKFHVAFAFFPTSIDDLMKVADSNNVMPPKSTWFEPKLRSGLITHLL